MNVQFQFDKMKITLNETFCKRIWKTHVRTVKEPNRTRKIIELCFKLVQENNIELNERNKGKIKNGVRDFLRKLKETEIQIDEEEDGKFWNY